MNREFAVDHRILGGEVGLVKVVHVIDVRGPEPAIEDDGRVLANEDGNGAGAASGSRVALGVDSDVGADGDGVPPVVVVVGAHPVYAVEKCGRAAVAGIAVVHAQDIAVARTGEQLHQRRLGALGFVNQRFRAHLEVD